MSQRLRSRYARHPVRNARRIPRNIRKPNYRFLVALFFFTTIISGLASFAFQTPSLLVREVKISGVCLADKKSVQSAGELALGRNIILLRKSNIISRISSLPEVKEVNVDRRFPNKVWIFVTERRPDAILTDGRVCSMIQLDGLMFHRVSGPVRGIPTVQVARCDPICVGRISRSQNVQYALDALACARREKLAVTKISVDHVGDICLNMEDGFYVKLGQPDEIPRKMAILRSALVCKPSIGREAVYIDLSCPNAPVWKPKSVAGSAS